jgi:hypothetical protein
MLKQVNDVLIRKARKTHYSDYSGKTIPKNTKYVVLTCKDSDESFSSYKVTIKEYDVVMKTKLKLEVGDDFQEIVQKVRKVKDSYGKIWDRYKDVPGIDEIWRKAVEVA